MIPAVVDLYDLENRHEPDSSSEESGSCRLF
jgi:hypothetical protein